MCDRCDAEFAAMPEDVLRDEAKNVAVFAADLIARIEPTPGGAVALTAIGHALQVVMREGLEVDAAESFTPKMREIAEHVGDLAAALIREGYRKTPIIVGAG